MLTRNRRLLLHATLALGMGVLTWLFLQLESTGAAKLLVLAAAGASALVGAGFAVRFLSVVSSGPDQAIPAAPTPAGGGQARPWTESALIGWVGLCIAALAAEAARGGLAEPQRAVFALACLLIVGVIAMQGIRLVREEDRRPAR